MHRLLDHDEAFPKIPSAGSADACSQNSRNALKLLKFSLPSNVAKKFPPVSRISNRSSSRNRAQVSFRVREEFDLEIAQAVFADRSFQILGQAIIDTFASRNISGK